MVSPKSARTPHIKAPENKNVINTTFVRLWAAHLAQPWPWSKTAILLSTRNSERNNNSLILWSHGASTFIEHINHWEILFKWFWVSRRGGAWEPAFLIIQVMPGLLVQGPYTGRTFNSNSGSQFYRHVYSLSKMSLSLRLAWTKAVTSNNFLYKPISIFE